MFGDLLADFRFSRSNYGVHFELSLASCEVLADFVPSYIGDYYARTVYPKDLLNVVNYQKPGDELAAMRKRKEHCQRPADSLRTPEFVTRVHGMMDKNPGKSMRCILPKIIKCLKEQQNIRNVARSVYMDENNSRESFNACKATLKRIETPKEQKSLIILRPKKFYQDEKVKLKRQVAMCGRTPLKFQLSCMCTKFPATLMVFDLVRSLKVNSDANVETPQAIVTPPWIDSIANGGRAYVFQQDSAPSHKAPKTQDYMDGKRFSSSCYTKVMATS
ncbi:hypothetical protein ACTXT7_003762 [Hymenolepis weldensis]